METPTPTSTPTPTPDFSNEGTDPQVQEMLLSTEDISPKEAVKNIERAERYEMHPDEYVETNNLTNGDMNKNSQIQEEVPEIVSSPVKRAIASSSQHAAAIKPELGAWEQVSLMADYAVYKAFGEEHRMNNVINDMNYEDKTSEKGLSDEDRQYLNDVYDLRDKKNQSFNLDFWGKSVGDVAAIGSDVVRAVDKYKGYVLGATVAAAGAGAFAGTMVLPFAPITATAGAITAGGATLGLALPVTFAVDAYYRVSTGSFGDLGRMKDDKGQPLNLSRDTKSYISTSVGIVSAIGEAFTGKALTGGMAKIFSKNSLSYIVKSPTAKAAFEFLGHSASTASTGSAEEVVSEVAIIVSEHYARGVQTEEGFLNALHAAGNDILNNPETIERLKDTAIIGFLGTGAIGGVTAAPGAVKAKIGYEDSNVQLRQEQKQRRLQNAVNMSVKSLDHQDNFLQIAAMVDSTGLKNLSPAMTSKFMQDVFETSGHDNDIWISREDMQSIEESDPDIAKRLEDADMTEASASDVKAALAIKPHIFLGLVQERPSLSEHMRLNPESPSPLESVNVMNNFNEGNKLRQEMFEELGVDGTLSTEQIAILDGSNNVIDEAVEKAGPDGYLDNDAEFAKAVEVAIPESQRESYYKAHQEAKQAVADQLLGEFEAKEQRIEDRVVKANKKIIAQQVLKEQEVSLRVAEGFKSDKETVIESHAKKGYSELAIDPKYLPSDLKEAYLSDPKLKKNKVFVEGGISLDESAAFSGVKSGEELLKILANVPTKKEMKADIDQRTAELRKEVQKSRTVNVDVRRDEVFDNVNKLQIKQLNFMKQHKWPAVKQGVKAVTSHTKLSNLDQIKNEAKGIVSKTKVGYLNPKQFNAAERTLNKKSLNHMLKDEVIDSIATKEKAILNSELTRESLRVQKKITEAKVVVKRITSLKGKKLFEKANMTGEVNQILDLFDLTGSKPKGVRRDSYYNYLDNLNEEYGNTVLNKEDIADPRQVGTDLTTNQYLRITDKLKGLEFQAKNENKLLKASKEQEKLNKIQTLESTIANAIPHLESHINHDPNWNKNTVANNNSKAAFQKTKEFFQTIEAMNTNFKNILVQADGEALGGHQQELIGQRMVDSEQFQRLTNRDIKKQIEKISADYGKKEFFNAFNDFVDIPEFKGYKALGNGSIARTDLWVLLAYLGDPGSLKKMENFKHDTHETTGEHMTVETIQRVLDRVLTEKDAKTSQNFVNIFKSFEQQVKDLHERTTGVVPNMVKGVPITHKGKVSEGGYVPNNHLNIGKEGKAVPITHKGKVSEGGYVPNNHLNIGKAGRFLDIFGSEKKSSFGVNEKGMESSDKKLQSQLRTAEMTEQGRTVERVGSKLQLDIDFRSFLGAYEEHVHDLAYRESGTDVLKILRDEDYAHNMKAIVGEAKYDTLVNAVIETVGNPHGDDILNPFSKDAGVVYRTLQKFNQSFAIGLLAGKATSVGLQPLSIGAASLRMGPKGKAYLTKALGNTIVSLGTLEYNKRFAEAVEINPDLDLNQDNIDDSLNTSIYDVVGKTGSKSKHAQKKAIIKKYNDKIVEIGMMGLSKTDIHIKAMVTLASYSQFMNGDVANFSTARLEKMTPIEREKRARNYAKQIADLALTTSATIDKTAVEKMAVMMFFTKFYVDVRAQKLTVESQARKVQMSGKQALGEFREGDTKSAMSSAKRGALDTGSLFLIYTMMQMWQDNLYDEENPLTEIPNIRDMDELGEFVSNTAKYVATAPFKGYMGSMLGVRDAAYMYSSEFHNARISLPMTSIGTDMVNGMQGISSLITTGSMSKKQRRATLMSLSYAAPAITGGAGIPARFIDNVWNAIEDNEAVEDTVDLINREGKKLSNNVASFIKDNEHKKEMETTIEALVELESEMVPVAQQNMDHFIPEDSMEVLKMNEWDDLDPNTGAAGIYQFTEERWEQIQESDPTLGISDEGRLSKDTREQEKAMKWANKDNAEGLKYYNVPVNNATLYGAHRFGLEDYVGIYLASNNDKLTEKVRNEKLFIGFKNVEQVKSFIKSKVKG